MKIFLLSNSLKIYRLVNPPLEGKASECSQLGM